MYETDFEYSLVKARYPAAVAEIERNIKASKYTFRGKKISETPIDQMRFYFSCYVSIGGSGNAGEMMRKVASGEYQREQAEKQRIEAAKTVEQKYADALARLGGYSLHASVRGSSRSFRASLSEIPAEVVAKVKAGVDRDLAENRRRAALTPEQRAQETAKLLQELGGMPGFVGIRAGGGRASIISPFSAMAPTGLGSTKNDLHMQNPKTTTTSEHKPKADRFVDLDLSEE